MVGGNMQTAASNPRNSMEGIPCSAPDMYTRLNDGIANCTNTAHSAKPISSLAYNLSGCPDGRSRGSHMLPMHNPPMNVASRIPSETEVDPMASCNNWYHTTS